MSLYEAKAWRSGVLNLPPNDKLMAALVFLAAVALCLVPR